MATLTDDDMADVRRVLGDNLLSTGASPYFGIMKLWDVIRDNVSSSSTAAATSSSTTVSASGPTTLTLASVTGLAVGQRLMVDSDQQREVCTIRAISGSTVSVVCTRTHSGTYPVEIVSPLAIVRGLIADDWALEQRVRDAWGSAGLKQVDEVAWFSAQEGGSVDAALSRAKVAHGWRLAQACGVAGILREAMAQRGAGGSVEVY